MVEEFNFLPGQKNIANSKRTQAAIAHETELANQEERKQKQLNQLNENNNDQKVVN